MTKDSQDKGRHKENSEFLVQNQIQRPERAKNVEYCARMK